MTLSIRNFLLINLLLVLTISASCTVIGNYYLDQQEIEDHLDNLLTEAALSFKVLIGTNLQPQEIQAIQNGLNEIPAQAEKFLRNRTNYSHYKHQDKYIFQIWDERGNLLLHSLKAPTHLIGSGKEGFSDAIVNNEKWRTFTAYDPKLHLKLIFAENYSLRTQLVHKITLDDVLIMLLIFPIAGVLIWVIITHSLSSIKRVADEVSHRAVNYLEPVDLKAVPKEIKPLVDELNKLFLRLQQAFEREQRFAADAAHELRTPLAVLKTQAQVALLTSDAHERKQILEEIIKSVDRSAHVVQQLLTVSRIAPDTQNLNDFNRIDLVKLTAEIIANLVPFALEKSIEIELDTKLKNAYILGNQTALGILIRNLVDNAIRYTPTKGQIKVSIANQAKHIIWHILDTGPGIPVELRSRVFERFFRVLGNQSTGCGLGLAIVQQIAQLHQADLSLGSPEHGTGLIVTLRFKQANTDKLKRV